MRNHPLLALAAALALCAPAVASADAGASAPWSLGLTLWGGRTRYDVLGLADNVSSISQTDGKDLLQGSFNTTGAQLLVRIGWLDLGALYEGSWPHGAPSNVIITPVVGVAWNLSDLWRLDFLGELGGHQITGIGESGSFDVSQAKSVWLPSVGLRAGISLRPPVGPVRLVLSLTPFARWDLVQKTVTVNLAGGTNEYRSYTAGGSTIGLVGGIGIEL